MTKDESHNLLQEFLDKFKTPDTLTLEKYTDNGEKRDDFTYWVEWKLDCFGGIKGGSSYKFGIYKYNKRPGADVKSDNQYAWGDKLGNTCDEAFGNVKKKILDVIKYSSGDTVEYNNIEAINLGPAFKWKIAFLYSKNRLVPVYKKEALFQAAKRLEVLPEKVTVASLQKALMDYYNKHADKFDNDICSYGSYVWTIGNADLSQSNQIIKYGAPGTGKTYSVEIEAKEFFDIWQLDAQNSTEDFKDHYEFVQFHPSYSYEDFIEGIKPVLGADGNTKLQLKDGIFKTFCRKAAQYEIWLLKNGIMKPGDQEKGKLSEILVKDVRINSCEKCPISIPENAKDDEPVQDYIPPYFFVFF